jgi:hypothetical protein
LALVVGQDVEPAEGSDGRDGRWRIARKVAPDRVISTVDPQARHTRKSQSNRKDGYRAHMVAEPETGLITDEALTMAAGADNSNAALAQQFLTQDEQGGDEQSGAPSGDGPTAADPAPGPGGDTADETTTSDNAATGDPAESAAAAEAAAHDRAPAGSNAAGSNGQAQALSWYGDSAYGTDELRGEIERAGHHAVIKPKPVQPAVPGGFTIDDFTVDEDSGTVTCPAALKPAVDPRARSRRRLHSWTGSGERKDRDQGAGLVSDEVSDTTTPVGGLSWTLVGASPGRYRSSTLVAAAPPWAEPPVEGAWFTCRRRWLGWCGAR